MAAISPGLAADKNQILRSFVGLKSCRSTSKVVGDVRRKSGMQAETNSSGLVQKVSGLRICDASVMPTIPCANTNIPTIMVGEKIAATILGE